MKFFKKRLFILIAFIFPVIFVYLVYFLITEFYIFPIGSSKSARAFASIDYANSLQNSEVDYLIAGDSTAFFGINPREISDKSRSVSMLAAPIYSTYKTLITLENLKINKAIILTQTFIKDHYELDIWGFFVPSKIYSFDDVKNIFCDAKIDGCTLYLKAYLTIRFLMSRLHLTSYSLKELFYRVQYDGFEDSNLRQKNLKSLHKYNGFYSRSNTNFQDKELFFTPYVQHFSEPFPLNIIPHSEQIHLSKIIDMAVRKNIKIYYVIMPFAATTYGISTKKYFDGLIDYLKPIFRKKVKIIDCRYIESAMKPEDFVDFSHVNIRGSLKVGECLRQGLKLTSVPIAPLSKKQ